MRARSGVTANTRPPTTAGVDMADGGTAVTASRTGTPKRRTQRTWPSRASTAATAPVEVAMYTVPPSSTGESSARIDSARMLPLVAITRDHAASPGDSRSTQASAVTFSKRAVDLRTATMTRPSTTSGTPCGTAPSKDRSPARRSIRASQAMAPVARSTHASPPEAGRAPAAGTDVVAIARQPSVATPRGPSASVPPMAVDQRCRPVRASSERIEVPSATTTCSPSTEGRTVGKTVARPSGSRHVSPQRAPAEGGRNDPGPSPGTAVSPAAGPRRAAASSASTREARGPASRSCPCTRSRSACADAMRPRAMSDSASLTAASRPAAVSSRWSTSQPSAPSARRASASGPTSRRNAVRSDRSASRIARTRRPTGTKRSPSPGTGTSRAGPASSASTRSRTASRGLAAACADACSRRSCEDGDSSTAGRASSCAAAGRGNQAAAAAATTRARVDGRGVRMCRPPAGRPTRVIH